MKDPLGLGSRAMTLDEVAAELKMSKQMVWITEQRALRKLRRMGGWPVMQSLKQLARMNEQERNARRSEF